MTEKSDETNQDIILSGIYHKELLRITMTCDDGRKYGEIIEMYCSNGKFIRPEYEYDDHYGAGTWTIYYPNKSFMYSIRTYNGGDDTVLSDSNVTVHVYRGNRLSDIYHVSSGNVFYYDAETDQITPLETIY